MYQTIHRKMLLSLAMLLTIQYAIGQERTDKKNREREPGFWESLYEMVFRYDHRGNATHQKAEQGVYRVINFEKTWKFQIGDQAQWSSPDLDDASWDQIFVPADWENEGFNGYDGYAWYRIHFDGKLLKPNEAHYLLLGFIDDVDETYLNGQLIGRTGRFPPRYRTAYNSDRKYFLSHELINFEGDNVIAVKVYDEYKNGGIVNGRPGIYVSEGSESLLQNLYGPWKFSIRNSKVFSEPDFDDTDWDNLLVPAYWDNQGYHSLDGVAWYRKSFKLGFVPDPGEDYYLVLGRIDDFDVTFLNGKLIGQTSDDEPFGISQSYRTIRVYKIPKGLLRLKSPNIIAVKVIDIGIDGGMYDGPIGIISEKDLTKTIRQQD